MRNLARFIPFYLYVGAQDYVIRSLDEWEEFIAECNIKTETLKTFIRIKFSGVDYIFGSGLSSEGDLTLGDWALEKNPGMFMEQEKKFQSGK